MLPIFLGCGHYWDSILAMWSLFGCYWLFGRCSLCLALCGCICISIFIIWTFLGRYSYCFASSRLYFDIFQVMFVTWSLFCRHSGCLRSLWQLFGCYLVMIWQLYLLFGAIQALCRRYVCVMSVIWSYLAALLVISLSFGRYLAGIAIV